MRFLVWTECILYAEAMSEAAVNPSSLSLGNLRGRDRSNCNVSVPVMYSLICGISVSLADGENCIFDELRCCVWRPGRQRAGGA